MFLPFNLLMLHFSFLYGYDYFHEHLHWTGVSEISNHIWEMFALWYWYLMLSIHIGSLTKFIAVHPCFVFCKSLIAVLIFYLQVWQCQCLEDFYRPI